MRRTVATVVFTTMVMACGGGSDDSGGVPDGTASMASAPDGDSTSDDAIGESVDGDDLETLLNSEPVYADLILDGSTRVEAVVTVVDGGELTTTSANGDVFRVMVPPGALPVDTVISLTAASDGVVSGVDIEPDGLPLNELTVVEMTPASGVDYVDLVWWNGTGELHRPLAAVGDDGVIRFVTDHFSGYGASTTVQPVVEGTVDQVIRKYQPEITEAAKRASTGDSSFSTLQESISGQLEAVWRKHLLPMVKNVGTSECRAEGIYRESYKILQQAQLFGIDGLDEWIQRELTKYADDFYSAAKSCARKECGEGNLNAPSRMVRAVSMGQVVGSTAALNFAMSDLEEIYGGGATSFWARCRVFDVFLSVSSRWEFGDQTFGATLQGTSAGKGAIEPSADGSYGTIGTYEGGSGWADFTSRFGTTLMTGLTSLIAGQLTERNVSCVESSSGRGQVKVTLKWPEAGPPKVTLEPLGAPIRVTCSSDMETSSGDLPNPAYLLLTLDAVTESWKSTIEHQFTPAEYWPFGYGAPIGFLWNQTIDFLPIVGGDGLTRVAEARVYLKVVLGAPNAPRTNVPSAEGLVPTSQGMTPVTSVP